jgi:hypothetical protein
MNTTENVQINVFQDMSDVMETHLEDVLRSATAAHITVYTVARIQITTPSVVPTMPVEMVKPYTAINGAAMKMKHSAMEIAFLMFLPCLMDLDHTILVEAQHHILKFAALVKIVVMHLRHISNTLQFQNLTVVS